MPVKFSATARRLGILSAMSVIVPSMAYVNYSDHCVPVSHIFTATDRRLYVLDPRSPDHSYDASDGHPPGGGPRVGAIAPQMLSNPQVTSDADIPPPGSGKDGRQSALTSAAIRVISKTLCVRADTPVCAQP